MPPSRQSSLTQKGSGSRSGSGSASAVVSTSNGKVPLVGTDTVVNNTGGRSTPQSAMIANSAAFGVNRPGSANAINRRRSEHTVSSPVEPHFPHNLYHHHAPAHQQASHHHHPQHHPHASVFEEDGLMGLDDEQGKGHGVGRRASAGFTTASGRWTPTILSNMLRRAEGRFSPVNTFSHSTSSPLSPALSTPQGQHRQQPVSPRVKMLYAEPEEMTDNHEAELQGRRTPARYRPATETSTKLGLVVEKPIMEQGSSPSHTQPPVSASLEDARKVGYYPPASAPIPQQSRNMHHPLSHSHKMSVASSTSASSHSISMHSPQMISHSRHTSMQKSGPMQPSPVLGPSGNTANSSPLFVPQARRGAINLRPTTRRRKATSAARRARSASHSVPMHVQVIRMLRLVFWTFTHPLGAFRSAQCFLASSLQNLDRSFRDPRTGERVWRPSWLGAYIPLLIWLVVSLSSTFTVLVWHTQVFQALDRLSTYLQSLGLMGRIALGLLIFLTTFPPLPLYSTLIILCGFSFGLVQGFIISYIAALSGAIVVFLLSRSLLKGWMVGLLNQSGGLKKVVRAIEKRPKLLFLVRLAPYPYNLMNTLLASSPTLTFKTYTVCTALALPKLLVHCGLGTTIKNFAAYNGAAAAPEAPFNSNEVGVKVPPMLGSDLADQAKASETAELIKHVFGFVGVGLCVGIFLYLFSIARKAVDEELDEDEIAGDEYELMLSGEEDSVDELEDDDLNIAGINTSRNGSSESTRLGEEGSSSRRTSSQTGHDSQSPRANGHAAQPSASFAGRVNGSDATLVDGRNGLLSAVNLKPTGANDGSTPLFVAPSSGAGGPNGDGSGGHAGNASYFGAWSQPSGRTSLGSKRYMESQASLADSIVEMEKHATAMDSDDVFSAPDQRHDISIELSPPPVGRSLKGTDGRGKGAITGMGAYDTHDYEEDEADERKGLIEVDRNRASRRSQMGYEEQQYGAGFGR